MQSSQIATAVLLPAVQAAVQSFEHESATVEIAALDRAGSPRSSGIDVEHMRSLLGAITPLPPILVHRPTMQIIDGFHRVAAALHQGLDSLPAQFVDGPADLVFVMAVRANVTHGLPLSLADRRGAATRIIRTHSQWSDRAIAEITGLSSKTVRGIRSEEEDDAEHDARLGRDGRLRPLNSAAGRALAAELIRARPEASLREIAAEAGVSPNTVRDVRTRLRLSDDPIPAGSQNRSRGRRERLRPTSDRQLTTDVAPVLNVLSRDPALRMNTNGRNLLRWVHLHAVGPDTTSVFQPAPEHCVEHLIELAKRCSANWAKVAAELEQAHRTKRAI